MKLRFSRRDKWVLTVALVVIVLLVFYAQCIWLAPLKSDLALKQQLFQTDQQLLTKTAPKKTVPAAVTAETTRALQEKVPVKPLEDQLILDLEQAESLSNSQIKSMNFTKDVQVSANPAPQGQAAAQTGTKGGQTSAAASGQTQPAANPPASAQANTAAAGTAGTNQQVSGTAAGTSSAQSGLKKLTVQLSVESPSYEDFEKFIGTIESLQRIVAVENISYSGAQEAASITQGTKPLTYSLTVSAFYMPGLPDLKAGLPKMDTPAPANKENPLSTISNASP